ncbi:MAG: hypothetical protein CMK74_00490 [Pseudomonadales bacterium]|nr:hypothetical protein [Pseudomonadales bacterium]
MSTEEQWKNLSIKTPAEVLAPVKSTISTVTTTLSGINQLHVAVMKAFVLLATTALSTEDMALKTALSAIEKLLDKFTKEGKIHLLPVSPMRQNHDDPSDTILYTNGEDSWSLATDVMGDTERQQFAETMKLVSNADRGNEGFARTVIESLYDEEDSGRPQYDAESAVFALVIVAGAKSFVKLNKLMKTLNELFGASLGKNDLIPGDLFKAITELKATPIASPESSRVGVLLSWVNPPTEISHEKYGGGSARLDEIAIIRSTKDEVMLATSWADIFGKSQPAALGENNFKSNALVSADKKTKVIRQIGYDGMTSYYRDDDVVRGTDYYYTVAYRYSVVGPATDVKATYVLQEYNGISNVVKMRIPKKIPPSKGVEPNWMTHPSILSLIPTLEYTINSLKAYVIAYKARIGNTNKALQSYVDYLEAEGKRYTEFANEILAAINKTADLLDLPAAGLYVTAIDLAEGGVNAFASELATRMSNTSDTSAPPFFKSGVVTGVVMLMGAPNPAAFQEAKDFTNFLFNPPNIATAWESAVDSIDVALTTVEQAVTSSTEQAQKTFDDAMQPVLATSEKSNVPFDP